MGAASCECARNHIYTISPRACGSNRICDASAARHIMLVLDLGEVDMFATKNNEWVDRLTPAPQGEGGFDACWYPVAMSDEVAPGAFHRADRSEEHTSELQSLMRTSYAVFCLQ